MYNINRDSSLLPNHTIAYDVQYVPPEDSFRTTKKVCGQVEHGILALFGPSDLLLGSHIQVRNEQIQKKRDMSDGGFFFQSICDALDIPHLESRNSLDDDDEFREFSLNLQPSQNLMNQAYKVKKR